MNWDKPVRFIDTKQPVRVLAVDAQGTLGFGPVVLVDTEGNLHRANMDGHPFENIPDTELKGQKNE